MYIAKRFLANLDGLIGSNVHTLGYSYSGLGTSFQANRLLRLNTVKMERNCFSDSAVLNARLNYESDDNLSIGSDSVFNSTTGTIELLQCGQVVPTSESTEPSFHSIRTSEEDNFCSPLKSSDFRFLSRGKILKLKPL